LQGKEVDMSFPTLLLAPDAPSGGWNERPEPAEQRSWTTPHHQGRVLVVDDDGNICKLIAWILEEAGFEVDIVPDPNAALQAVASAAQPFDMVITDIRMPVMDGWELGRRIQQQRPTPVLYISGYDPVRPAASPEPFLRKPFEPADLLARVRGLLSNSLG
jgi:DNA-binding response OmpR family regulator